MATRADRFSIVSILAVLVASLYPLTPARAIDVGNQPIPFTPVQKVTQIPAVYCNFVTGMPTPAGGAKGCDNKDGSYSKSGNDYILHLNNTQDLKQIKFVLLSILLTAAGAQGFAPIADQFPTLTPSYNVPVPNPVTTPMAESWIPGQETLQFEWTINPQPASEDVTLNSFNVMKNGHVVPFDVSWMFSVSLQSHCPEPATWTMMTIGFGLVGWSSRRRRAAAPLPHAGLRARIA
jgi:hypothetical protein